MTHDIIFMEEYGIIYRIWSKTTGMSYIGQTVKGLTVRVQEHLRSKLVDKFHNAIRELGKDDFVYEVIEVCPIDKLNEREKHWIKVFDSFNNGYNNDLGGTCCRDQEVIKARGRRISELYHSKSEEEKQKFKDNVSAGTKAWWDNASDSDKQEWAEKVSISLKNYNDNLTEEEKIEKNKNVSIGINNMPEDEKQRLANIRSENLKNRYASKTEEEIKEWRTKISISHRSAYVVTDLKTYEIYEFLGAEECSKFLGITKQMLSHIINGRRRPVPGYTVIKKDGK